MALFHLAFNVIDLDATRALYGGLLGCAEGRASAVCAQMLSRVRVVETTPVEPQINTSERGRGLGCRQAGPRTLA